MMGIAQMLWVTGTWIATNRVDQHRAAPAVTMAALKLLDGSSKERDPLRGASQEPALPASTSYPQLLATVASCHLRPPTHDRLFRFLLPPGVEYQTAMRAYSTRVVVSILIATVCQSTTQFGEWRALHFYGQRQLQWSSYLLYGR